MNQHDPSEYDRVNEPPTNPPEPGRPDDEGEPRRRTRLWVWLVFGVLGLLILLIVLAALLPPILSTDTGRGFITRTINGAIPGSVEIDSLSLSWTGGQQARGVRLMDPDGERVLAVEEAATDLSLWDAVRGELDLGRTVVRELDGDIVVDETGRSNFQEAIGAEDQPEDPDQPYENCLVTASRAVDVELIDARLSVRGPDMEPVVFEDLSAAAALASITDPLTLNMRGRTTQGEMTGDFMIDGHIADLFNTEGRITADQADADLTARADQLPVAGLDRLAGMDGLLVEALGDRANVTAQVGGTTGSQDVTLHADAPNATADLTGRIADGVFNLTEPAVVKHTLSPALVQRFTGEGDDAVGLQEPVGVTLTIDRLTAPLPEGDGPAFQPGATVVSATLTADDRAHLTGVPRLGGVFAEGLRAELGGESLADFRASVSASIAEAEAGLLSEAAGPSPLELRFDASAGLGDDGLAVSSALAELRGDRLRADVPMAMTSDGVLGLREPGTVSMTVTPELMRQLGMDGEGQPTLAAPAEVDLTLAELSVPTRPFDIAGIEAAATGRIGTLELTNPVSTADATGAGTGGERRAEGTALRVSAPDAAGTETAAGATVRNVVVEANFNGPSGSAKLRMNGETSVPDRDEPGTIAVEADAGDLLRDGELDAGGASVDARANLTGLPTPFLDTLAGQGGRLTAVLGPIVDGTINAELTRMSGPIAADLNASNFRAPIRAELRDGLLTLTEDLRAELDVTPELGDLVLRNVNPLLITALRSDSPIVLTAQAEDFRLPVESFDIQRVRVPEARLEIGELVAENSGPLGELLRLVGQISELSKSETFRGLSSETQRVRFSPLIMHFADGVADYQRMDVTLLGPDVSVSTSGRVLWIGEGGEELETPLLDMVLALGAGTLENLGLEGLDDSFRVPIAMTGPTTEPQINFDSVVPSLLEQLPASLLERYLPEESEDVRRLLEGIGNPEGMLDDLLRRRGGDGGDGTEEPPQEGDSEDAAERAIRGLLENLTRPRE